MRSFTKVSTRSDKVSLNKLDLLIKRQREIEIEIQNLTKELLKHNDEISLLAKTLGGSKKYHKEVVIKNLTSLGITVKNETVNGTRVWRATNRIRKFIICHKESSYRNEGKNNAWYTLNPQIENWVDFFIFSYTDNFGKQDCIIIEKVIMQEILQSIKRTPDGRANINLLVANNKIIENSSKKNLTQYINNFKAVQIF